MTQTPAAVSPWIVAQDADGLLAFLADVFGAEETGRVANPDGSIGHAETVIGGAGAVTIVVVDVHEGWAPAPALLRIQVTDLATVVARATRAGARVVTERTSLPVGDDVVRLTDPWGNLWWVHERVEDVAFETLLQRMEDPETLAAMLGFDASLDEEMRRRGSTDHAEH